MKIRKVEFFGSFYNHEDVLSDPRKKIVFSGRSNVGKSSLINTLLGRKIARVSKAPGKTRSINLILVNDEFFLVDLPGYGYAKVSKSLRALWGPMIEGFLKRDKSVKGAFILVDARRDPGDWEYMLSSFYRERGIPFVFVFTKVDKLSSSERKKRFDRISGQLALDREFIVPFSSRTGEGKDRIWGFIKTMLEV